VGGGCATREVVRGGGASGIDWLDEGGPEVAAAPALAAAVGTGVVSDVNRESRAAAEGVKADDGGGDAGPGPGSSGSGSGDEAGERSAGRGERAGRNEEEGEGEEEEEEEEEEEAAAEGVSSGVALPRRRLHGGGRGGTERPEGGGGGVLAVGAGGSFDELEDDLSE
jgi:hypothetical protein